jgi:hypothetical protein
VFVDGKGVGDVGGLVLRDRRHLSEDGFVIASLVINKETKEMAPVPQFLNIPQLIQDVQKVTDAARGKRFSNFMMGLALLKNYHPFKAPPSLTLLDILKKFDKTFGLTGRNYGKVSGDRSMEDIQKRRQDPWNFLFIAGMWFQDLFNYDFRRTEMCIIPYATQKGEISFCAYNTGVGWRKIIEHLHKNATVAEWYRKHGKHEVFAKGKTVSLETYDHSLKINEGDASRKRELAAGLQTAAEEERWRKQLAREAAEVRKIYEELVLNKKPESELVQIGAPLSSGKPLTR